MNKKIDNTGVTEKSADDPIAPLFGIVGGVAGMRVAESMPSIPDHGLVPELFGALLGAGTLLGAYKGVSWLVNTKSEQIWRTLKTIDPTGTVAAWDRDEALDAIECAKAAAIKKQGPAPAKNGRVEP